MQQHWCYRHPTSSFPSVLFRHLSRIFTHYFSSPSSFLLFFWLSFVSFSSLFLEFSPLSPFIRCTAGFVQKGEAPFFTKLRSYLRIVPPSRLESLFLDPPECISCRNSWTPLYVSFLFPHSYIFYPNNCQYSICPHYVFATRPIPSLTHLHGSIRSFLHSQLFFAISPSYSSLLHLQIETN